MKELINSSSIEGRIAQYLIVAVCAFFALKIGDNISAFFVSFTRTFHGILGYGLTGLLFGFVLWLMFERGARKIIYFLPLFLMLGQWVESYIAFSESGRSFSPLKVLGYMLTTELGFKRLVVIPVGAFAAVWLLKKYHLPPASVTADNSEIVR